MPTSSLDANKELIREYHDVLENQERDRIPDFFAADFGADFMQLEEVKRVAWKR